MFYILGIYFKKYILLEFLFDLDFFEEGKVMIMTLKTLKRKTTKKLGKVFAPYREFTSYGGGKVTRSNKSTYRESQSFPKCVVRIFFDLYIACVMIQRLNYRISSGQNDGLS